MTYILDTHISVWFLDNNKRLKPSFRAILADPQNTYMKLWCQACARHQALPGVDLLPSRAIVLPEGPFNHGFQLVF